MSTVDPQNCACALCVANRQKIENRPALPSIEYRIGTYTSFMDAMRVAASQNDALKAWTARSPRDFGMQFLDMWAYLGDILTFYQERIANEAYLRTATQRESVLRLAAALDYRLGPGAAAIVYFAFILEKGRTLTIPIGLRAQSVPGQNEKPQKFETVESVDVDAGWNQIRVFPEPVQFNPFSVGRTGGTLLDESARPKPLVPGSRVVLFDRTIAETKVVGAVRKTVFGTEITWTTPIQTTLTQPEAYSYERQFRLFGSQAPLTYMNPASDSTVPGGIRWNIVSPDFLIDHTTGTFLLEPVTEDLKPGCEMLLVHHTSDEDLDLITPKPGVGTAKFTGTIKFVRKAKVTAVTPVVASFGSLQAMVAKVQLQFTGAVPNGVTSRLDLRNAVLYELSGPAIHLATTRYPNGITGNGIWIPASVLADYPLKRSIILDDGHGEPHVATVDTASVSQDHLVIRFTPTLGRELATNSAIMFGNVVKATHGETVKNEVLGSGDAASRLQKFQLKKNPVTFVSQPGAPNGVVDTLDVRVDGVLWAEVRSLLGAPADARVYTTSLTDDGKMNVQFGGEPGSRLPSGRLNVIAQYRQGLGPDGNVRAGVITTLLDRPVGLKSVVNPKQASGGTSPESLETARANAPNTVRTFGRIVSLTDFEDAARELSMVAKAKSALSWNGQEEVVSVAVAGEGGSVLSEEVRRDILADLNSRRDTNRPLNLRSHEVLPVEIAGRVQADRAYLLDAVQAAVTSALLDLFKFDNRDLAEPAFKSDVFRIVQDVPGVVAVDLDTFRYRDTSGGPDVADVLTAQWFQILTLDAADIAVAMQFETL